MRVPCTLRRERTGIRSPLPAIPHHPSLPTNNNDKRILGGCAVILLPCRAALLSLCSRRARHPRKVLPSQPIKLIVPYPAGSLVDVLGRAIGETLSGSLKQPVVVDNRAGASTLIGAKAVASAPPDGYTLLIPTVTTLSIAPQLMSKPGIDPLSEFTPIARLGATSFFLSVHPSFPARTMAEWIDAVKKHPGKYTYASAGNGTPHHIFMELLKTAARSRHRACALQRQ